MPAAHEDSVWKRGGNLTDPVKAALSKGLRPGGRTSSRIRGLAELCLLVIFAILAAQFVLKLLTPLELPVGELVVQAPQTAAVSNVDGVRNPFPVTEISAAIIEEESAYQEDVEDTTLDLTLTGVWADGSGAGSATIRTPDNKQMRYSVDDEILDGVALEEVYADHVVISRDGRREALRFENKERRTDDRSQRRRVSAPPAPTNPPVSTPANLRGDDGDGAAQANLLSIVRFAPERAANGGIAIGIYASRNRKAFADLGLNEGDKLISIDGQAAPTDLAQLQALQSQVQRKPSLAIEVDRNGDTIPIIINLEDLGLE